MSKTENLQLFEDQPIRTAWDNEQEEWYFSIVDVVGVLSESKDPTSYWRKLKQRLKEEGNERGCSRIKILHSSFSTLENERNPVKVSKR